MCELWENKIAELFTLIIFCTPTPTGGLPVFAYLTPRKLFIARPDNITQTISPHLYLIYIAVKLENGLFVRGIKNVLLFVLKHASWARNVALGLLHYSKVTFRQ